MKTLALLLALTPAVCSAGSFCFTNVFMWKAHPDAHFEWNLPPICTSATDTSTNPVWMDGACCYGLQCDKNTATHLLVRLPNNTNAYPNFLGMLTWVNAATGVSNFFMLYLPPFVLSADFELRADVAPCAASRLSWVDCGPAISRPAKRKQSSEVTE